MNPTGTEINPWNHTDDLLPQEIRFWQKHPSFHFHQYDVAVYEYNYFERTDRNRPNNYVPDQQIHQSKETSLSNYTSQFRNLQETSHSKDTYQRVTINVDDDDKVNVDDETKLFLMKKKLKVKLMFKLMSAYLVNIALITKMMIPPFLLLTKTEISFLIAQIIVRIPIII